MKRKISIIGNWKSNKNKEEVAQWFEQYTKEDIAHIPLVDLEVVVCPAFIHLPVASNLLSKNVFNIKLGAQDSSPFPSGAYTGEVTGKMIREFAEYVLIGHSERRKHFKEDDEILKLKVNEAKNAELQVIYCIPDENTPVPQNVDIIAYEPVWAIGTGKADSPQNANKVIGLVKERNPSKRVIYGGSVTAENVLSFINEANIDGVLPGGASLDPGKFSMMVRNANSRE